MKRQTFVSLVVRAHDEEETVAAFVRAAARVLEEHFALSEIVLVDDGSSDATAERAREAARQTTAHVVVLQLARRHGVEAAMKAGLDKANGDWVFEVETTRVDFDLSLLPRMYEHGARGYDVVTAAGDEGSWKSRLFYRFVNRYADLDTPLRTERVRLVSRRTLNAMLAMREKVRYRKALYAVVGPRKHHLHYEPVERTWTPKRLDRETSALAFDVLLSFSGFGLRLAHRMSFAFGAVSLFFVLYAVLIYLFKRDVPEGWTTVTVVLSGGLAGIFLVLGILGEYVSRILVEVRGRPLYALRDATTYVPDGPPESPEPPSFMSAQVAEAQLVVPRDDRAT